MPLIEVERFTKVFGETPAVDDLSFQVEGGQILGLVGPNGAGKTTTLRTLAGIFPPTRGVLRVAGSDVVKQPLEAKRRLALISDEPHLFETRNAGEKIGDHDIFIGAGVNTDRVRAARFEGSEFDNTAIIGCN